LRTWPDPVILLIVVWKESEGTLTG
jgi:hypothetical protein